MKRQERNIKKLIIYLELKKELPLEIKKKTTKNDDTTSKLQR